MIFLKDAYDLFISHLYRIIFVRIYTERGSLWNSYQFQVSILFLFQYYGKLKVEVSYEIHSERKIYRK